MNFSVGNLVKSVVGAVAKVATAVVNTVKSAISGISGMFSSAGGAAGSALSGAMAALGVVDVDEDGELDIDDAEEFLEEKFKLLVGAHILSFGLGSSSTEANSDEEKKLGFDFMTKFNNTITIVNKSSAVVTNAKVKTSDSLWKRIVNAADDFFMPTTSVESNAVKLSKGGLKKFGTIGGKAGLIGTAITPIMEYENSMEPYKDDLEAIAEYDPDNYEKYKKIAEVGAVADACTLGYVRGIINTPPTVAQLLPIHEPKWVKPWTDFVNENVNTRTIIEKTDEAFKDPVTGPKLKSFLRSDTLDQFKKKMKDDE
ncbi:hypothetical protein [Clostridium sp. ZBS2]|uniref:hypothetical protein n=1 Tax=Clostridium sp. ZBS2 TaxID=2949976 RepID=UPI002079AC12|nr:hypothetical protein [Clostridium sp. ZBS2]